jgi:hypothetical protein
VDDATWSYHLRRHDYSTWLRLAVKDEDLAREVLDHERRWESHPQGARAEIGAAISGRYTLPE